MKDDGPTSIADLLQASYAAERVGNLAEALGAGKRALELAQAAGDDERSGAALLACAQAHFRLGNYAECEQLSLRALEIASAESQTQANGLRILGNCALETNRMSAGEDYLRRSIALSRQIGGDRQLVSALHSLAALVYMPRGQCEGRPAGRWVPGRQPRKHLPRRLVNVHPPGGPVISPIRK